MLFNSIAFAIFFPLVTIMYFLTGQRWRWTLLLSASCIFYMYFRPVYILILFFTIIVDYYAGILIERSRERTVRKAWLIASIIANVSVLAFFKYWNFLSENFNAFTGLGHSTGGLPLIDILLPIGLSFHTFQALSYTIEVYRGNQAAEKHPGIYALYVMFYPQLVAGPIERPQHMLHQFRESHRFEYYRVSRGLRRMLWGFFKKMVIADRLAFYADQVYDHPQAYTGIALIWATIFFAVQIYCDFSGYCDIALGAASVMGFHLMENFRFPYFSASISEFWSRWHISLSTWFRDYVYIPLGGNKVRTGKWVRNIIIVFALSGLWHGAAWTFVIWGLLHGIYLLVSRFFTKSKQFAPRLPASVTKKESFSLKRILSVSMVFIFVSIAWIFFRASSLEDAIYILTHLAVFDGSLIGVPLISPLSFLMNWIVILLLLACERHMFILDNRNSLRWQNNTPAMNYAVNFLLAASILVFGIFEEQTFIYFQF